MKNPNHSTQDMSQTASQKSHLTPLPPLPEPKRRQRKTTKSKFGVGGQGSALAFFIMALSACSSMPTAKNMSTLPKEDNVVVSRVEPAKDCVLLSKIEGRTTSTKGTAEDALKDAKQEASNKGANYLLIDQYSAYGTSVTGAAYKCP